MTGTGGLLIATAIVAQLPLLSMFCGLVTTQVVLAYLSRKRFGDKNPRSQDKEEN
ncbi:hypothetical protein [Photobacterium angustum]|uniref:hypothetical protein n=1 Tax=Photobacterium angustum TaxID=661 RepID=UPI000ACE510B|nr:hypothetical protein [Photobacterium angustum]